MLLAQATSAIDKNEAFFRGLRDAVSNTYDPRQALLFWVSIALFLVIVGVLARHYTRKETHIEEPKADYLMLAVDFLGLSEDDRRDLRRIAEAANIEEPLVLLLSPHTLARAVESTDAQQRASLRARMNKLSLRLFEAPLPAIAS